MKKDKYSAKLIRQNREHPRCKNYGDVFYEIKIAMLLYKNNISIPEPITCDYIEVDGKLEMAFIMEYIDGTSFDLTDNKEIIELGEKLAEEESKKINKLGIFENVSGPQWILTNDKQIKLIDFEKWELKNETS
jgi:predicted Ser/Thr protein kinase